MTNKFKAIAYSKQELKAQYVDLRLKKKYSGSVVRRLAVHPKLNLYQGIDQDTDEIFVMFQALRTINFSLSLSKPWIKIQKVAFEFDNKDTCHYQLLLKDDDYEEEFVKIVKLFSKIFYNFNHKKLIIDDTLLRVISDSIDNLKLD